MQQSFTYKLLYSELKKALSIQSYKPRTLGFELAGFIRFQNPSLANSNFMCRLATKYCSPRAKYSQIKGSVL
jgi:hypothetical protein